MHSATLRGCPLGPRGLSTTTCALTTWAGAEGRGQRPSQAGFGWLSWHAWEGARGDAGQPQEHLDVEVVPMSPWPEVCHLLEHGGTLFCCHSGCAAVSGCSKVVWLVSVVIHRQKGMMLGIHTHAEWGGVGVGPLPFHQIIPLELGSARNPSPPLSTTQPHNRCCPVLCATHSCLQFWLLSEALGV